jgi:rRNA large subunit m3Psi methyltransferase RlmH
MRLIVAQQGEIRDAHACALRDEYVKRFRRFGSLRIVERAPRGDTPLWPDSARWRVALAVDGTAYSSERLAEMIGRWTMQHGEVAFAIGDAYGLHAPTLAAANAKWSLGPITLPHHLAHVVVIEQLYRAATILNKLPYHHG